MSAPPAYAPDLEHRARALFGGWERWLAALGMVLVVIMTTHSFQALFVDPSDDAIGVHRSASSNPIYLALFALQFGIFLLLAVYSAGLRGISRDLVKAALICIYVVLSAAWSVNAKTTLMQSTVFVYLVVAAYVLSVHFRPATFMRIYFWIGGLILAASFISLFAAPELTNKVRYGGGWFGEMEFSGVMSSKNFAGYVFASVFVLALHGRAIGVGLFSRLLLGGMAAVAVALSNSATAVLILMLLTSLSLFAWLTVRSREIILFTALLVFLAAIVLVPFVSLGGSFDVLGRDSTFTGRTELWRLAMVNIAEKPVLGFGYLSFFDTGSFSPAHKFWENFAYFLTDTFHNASLDVTVSLGLVGFVLFCGVCVRAATMVFNDIFTLGERTALAMLVAVFFIGGMMEFTIFHHNYIATLLVFYAAFSASRDQIRDDSRPPVHSQPFPPNGATAVPPRQTAPSSDKPTLV